VIGRFLAIGGILAVLCLPARAGAAPSPVWCATALPSDAESGPDPAMSAYRSGRAKLCAGDAGGARMTFEAILPVMKAAYRTDGTHWIDFGRSYFYALLASNHEDDARRFLSYFEDTWKPSSAERLFWNEDYAGSFAAYVADDGRATRSPDRQAEHKLDPHLPAALAAIRAGKLDDAIDDVKADPDSGSLYRLMLGNIYAQERDWPDAFTAWAAAAAAGPGYPQPGWYSLDEWNVSALEMMYYYRAHAPHE
jgi:hypothetical protein